MRINCPARARSSFLRSVYVPGWQMDASLFSSPALHSADRTRGMKRGRGGPIKRSFTISPLRFENENVLYQPRDSTYICVEFHRQTTSNTAQMVNREEVRVSK